MFHFLNLQNLFYEIYLFFLNLGSINQSVDGTVTPFMQFWVLLKILATFIGLALVVGAFYAAARLSEVKKKNKFIFPEVVPGTEKSPKQDQWNEVLKLLGSENPADWRLAILEADAILDELLSALNIVGETVGERLKNADPTSFRSLNDAWEGHKVRNRIAHEGLNFSLAKREARVTIEHFEKVFKEFKLI
jgi:hypothetical protein